MMRKQFVKFIKKIIINIGIIVSFFTVIFVSFAFIRVFFKRYNIDWTAGLISAVILYRFNIILDGSSSYANVVILIEVFQLIFVSLIFIYFFIRYYKHSNFWSKFKWFYLKLPFKNKLLLLTFTVMEAIPNKILVNSNRRFMTDVLGNLAWIYFCCLEPILWIIYIFVINTYIFSGIFAYMYENNFERSPGFQIQVKKYLFNGSDEFAKFYFDFFWGNMFSKARELLKQKGPAVGFTGLFFNEKITHEKKEVLNLHQQMYNAEIDRYVSTNGKIDVETMKTLSDKALNDAVYHGSSPVLNGYQQCEKINLKIGEFIDKILSGGSNGF